MAQPIEDAAKAATTSVPGSQLPKPQDTLRVAADVPKNAYKENPYKSEAPAPGPFFDSKQESTSAIENLIREQHLFIEALLVYIHTPIGQNAVGPLATAQEAYIRAQMKFAGTMLNNKR